MIRKPKDKQQTSFYTTFEEQLDHGHSLYILSNKIHWQQFEETFKHHYSEDMGAPSKPIRLMVALLILKHVRNLSDESVVEQWSENAYYQYLSGEDVFAAHQPCVPTELVEFRKRIGEAGIELIFKESIRVNGKDGQEKDATTDTTVQEKNITYPTDSKLHKKIITHCKAIADKEDIDLRQSYTHTIKKLTLLQRFRNHPKNHGKARKADKKIKTIAGRLIRELERKLPAINDYQVELELYKKILLQKRNDKQKIYSIHEPHVQCISKGKEHKKYEFGSKVSITTTKNSGVIIGAINIPLNDYDAHTLDPAIKQQQQLTGHVLENDYVDRGYRGVKNVLGTNIIVADNNRNKTAYQKQKLRQGFRRRAAIEPRIGHLKSDHRLSRNYYKGIFGDNINVMLAAAAMNFKRMMNKWKTNPPFYFFLKQLYIIIFKKSYFCITVPCKNTF
ncbi:MAG: IS5 family transposase [Bacteroidetes bacterium]|nr:IS5 family transposase [Bacteroidota bacterium]